MAFTFGRYGTFTGPSFDINYRDNDDFSLDPFDGYFNLDDVSMVLVNTTESPADYVYMHLDGSSTDTVTLERNSGPIPTFNVEANQTNFSRDVYIDRNLEVNNNLNVIGNITGATITDIYSQIASKKSFDIPHPTKQNYRLRYICLEGPDAEVYLRGKLVESNVIELPEYWKNLVDAETIGVTLTSIGVYQELFVEKIEWGQRIIIKNNLGGPINCSYVVYGERKDVSKNLPEYPGSTPNDYPGDNREYVINGGRG
jgi:hypothetical protein